jgi:hypothetical protein
MRSPKTKKTRDALDLEGLDATLPDLDTLIDPNASFDSLPIRERFGVKRAAFAMREKSRKVVTFDARKVGIAAETLRRLPAAGEYVHVVCGQEFSGFDLIPAMLQLSGAQNIRRLYLTTLGFSRDNLAQLELLLRAKQLDAPNLKILCGDFFRRADAGLWDIGSTTASPLRKNEAQPRRHQKGPRRRIRQHPSQGQSR